MEGLRTKVTGEQKSEEGKTFWVPADPKQKDLTVVALLFFTLSEVRKHALGEMDIAHSPGRKNAK